MKKPVQAGHGYKEGQSCSVRERCHIIRGEYVSPPEFHRAMADVVDEQFPFIDTINDLSPGCFVIPLAPEDLLGCHSFRQQGFHLCAGSLKVEDVSLFHLVGNRELPDQPRSRLEHFHRR